jgi:putative ABC transport system permease protein
MSLRTLWRNLWRRGAMERDLDAELNAYLDLLSDEKVRAGMEPREARRRARIEFGGETQVKEAVRHALPGRLLGELARDIRYGLRSLARNPSFTAIAALALALGIGANTAMFSVAYGVLLRPLPYPDSDRIALVSMRFYPRDAEFGTMSIRDYLEWKANNRAFEEPSLFSTRYMDLAGAGDPEQAPGAMVTAGFFSTMRTPPLLGRVFHSGEDAPGSAPVAILGESIWRRRFGASPAALGQVISVNGVATTIVGVMPESFRFPRADTRIWTNLPLPPPTRFGPYFYRGVARLKPGVTLEQAQRETNAVGQRLMQQNPSYKRLTFPVVALREAMVGSVKTPILVLLGAVALVLLIAVVNVANLMLARATVRQREMALRASLGAGRGRLIRQLLTESVLLAAIGGAGGLLVAYGGVELLRAWNPGNLPLIDFVRLDGRALLLMLSISIATGITFGLAPAFQSSQADLNSTLKVSRGRNRARAALVVVEIALSLMLLTGAGLLLRSFVRLRNVGAGFSAATDRLLTVLVSPGDRKYRDPVAGLLYYDRVLEVARRFPGVQAAAVSDTLPPTRQGDADTFVVQGQTLAPGEVNPVVTCATASDGYFQALGVPLLRGRYFNGHDTASSAPVAILSESMARRFFGGRDPVGMRLKQSGPGVGDNWMEIVGVVGDVKYLGLQKDTDAAYYMPFAQSYMPRMFLVLRTAPDAASIAQALRRELQSVDPGVTLDQVETMQQSLASSLAEPRFDTMLLVIFAAIALALAAVGIYGVVAYSVAQRTHEIGVRMALGAGQGEVWKMVLRQAARMAFTGIVIGLGGALLLTRLLKALLFGTSATDPLTFVGVATALLVVALVAAFVPARRATKISPVVALR